VTVSESAHAEHLALAHSEFARLRRRLRTLTEPAWRTRRDPVLTALARLAALTARLEGMGPRDLPDLPNYALADVAAVVGTDALTAVASPAYDADVVVVLDEFRRLLDVTR
jgi:hypothetical protein